MALTGITSRKNVGRQQYVDKKDVKAFYAYLDMSKSELMEELKKEQIIVKMSENYGNCLKLLYEKKFDL